MYNLDFKNDSVKIYIDDSRRLPRADPSGRDLYISIGCMLENLIIAASYFGLYERHVYHLKDNFVAEVFFKPLDNTQQTVRNMQQYLLFNIIAKRVNARGLFKNKPIDKAVLDYIGILSKMQFQPKISLPTDIRVDFVSDKEKIKRMAKLTARGLKIAHSSPVFRREMSTVFHCMQWRECGPDGSMIKEPRQRIFWK